MARGWESKHVEDQQSEARDRRVTQGPPGPGALDERRALELARADLRARLERCRSDAQRAPLQAALAALEERLSGSG